MRKVLIFLSVAGNALRYVCVHFYLNESKCVFKENTFKRQVICNMGRSKITIIPLTFFFIKHNYLALI